MPKRRPGSRKPLETNNEMEASTLWSVSVPDGHIVAFCFNEAGTNGSLFSTRNTVNVFDYRHTNVTAIIGSSNDRQEHGPRLLKLRCWRQPDRPFHSANSEVLDYLAHRNDHTDSSECRWRWWSQSWDYQYQCHKCTSMAEVVCDEAAPWLRWNWKFAGYHNDPSTHIEKSIAICFPNKLGCS